MVAYVVNKPVTDHEIDLLASASAGVVEIRRWPSNDISLPADASLGILIIRETSVVEEARRVISCVAAGIRLVCVYLDEVLEPAEIVKKYCSANCSLGGTGFADALKGDDSVQVDHNDQPLPKTNRKHHNC